MSLTVYERMEQGTDEWLEARRGIVTASVVGRLITPTLKHANNDTSRGLVRELVAERITGRVVPTYPSRDMERGTLDEPYAREVYAEHYAPVAEVGFMVREINGARLGYSPDGLVGDDGLIEIKSRQPKVHLAHILADRVPAENMAQIQCGLLVSGRSWCDYISYCGGMPLWTKRVTPHPAWQVAITDALEAFEEAAEDTLKAYRAAVYGRPETEYIDHYLDDVELKL